MSDQPPIHRLNYQAGRRPRNWLRRTVVLVVAAAVIFTGVRYGPAVWNRAVVLYWQRQCMNFQPPAEHTIVLDNLQPGEIVPHPPHGYLSLHFGYLPGTTVPTIWTGDQPAVVDAPICWRRLTEPISETVNLFGPDAIAFLHGRRSPHGLERLVAVGDWCFDPDRSTNRTLEASVIIPGGLVHAPTFPNYGVTDTLDGVPYVPFGSFNPRKIFAGVPDPSDESRFTIEFDWDDGVRGVIDGQLLDTGHVQMAIRPGPGDHNSYLQRLQNRNATQPTTAPTAN